LNHLVLEHLSGVKGGCPLEEAYYLKLSLFQGVEYFSEVFLCYIDVWFLTWGIPAKFRADTHGVYATASLNEYRVYIEMMLCRLFGRKIPTHFPMEWVPIIHEVAKGYTFKSLQMFTKWKIPPHALPKFIL
jgi:hypothetical protein